MSKASGPNAPDGYVVISEAIRLSGMARSTFYEYVTAGKVCVSMVNFKGKERKFIELSELLRVFGSLSGKQSGQSGKQSVDKSAEPVRTVKKPDTSEIVRLRTENEGLRALLDEVRQGKENAERDKERFAGLLTESMATVKLLEYRAGPGHDEKKSGFFSRWFKK